MAASPLSVLMVLDNLAAAGTETHVLSLSKALGKLGAKVSLAAADGPLRAAFEQAGCRVHLMDFIRNPGQRPELIAKLQEIIKQAKIDCVHAHQTPSGSLAAEAAAGLGIPAVFTAHGTYYPKSSLAELLTQSKTAISVSVPVQRYLQQFGASSQVIPNGIDLGEFYPAPDYSLRSELGIADDAVVIVYASRLAWGKATACDTLLRAMKDLHLYGWRNLQLVVVGEGPKFAAMKQLADLIHAETGRTFIHLVGRRTDMHRYYNGADLVVGTGRVALEALACGKPVLAAGNDGYFGWVEPGSYEEAWAHYFGDHASRVPHSRYVYASDIAEGCRRLETLKSIGSEHRRWVQEHFDIDRTALQVFNVYRSAAGRHS